MKTLTSIALLSVLLCTIVASAPPSTHASDWVSDLFNCTGNYITGVNTSWNTWYASPQTPADESELWFNLDQAFEAYQDCNSVVDIPAVPFDCGYAQVAYNNCTTQFEGTDDILALNACQIATRYDGMCR